jgi:hypothetical protein
MMYHLCVLCVTLLFQKQMNFEQQTAATSSVKLPHTLLELLSTHLCGFTITLTDYSQDACLLRGCLGVEEIIGSVQE